MDPVKAEHEARHLIEILGLAPHAGDALSRPFQRHEAEGCARRRAHSRSATRTIIDEPLTGLDAASARQVKAVLKDRVACGATVIMTTHILDVAERMAERIGVISNGKLIAQGTLEELSRKAGQDGGTLEEIFLTLVRRGCGSRMTRTHTLASFARHR